MVRIPITIMPNVIKPSTTFEARVGLKRAMIPPTKLTAPEARRKP
jgi:hypothetical protein